MRKIAFDSVEVVKAPAGMQVPGSCDTAYLFRRKLKGDQGQGTVEYTHLIPLSAVADAMTNFGYTAEEALEFHLLVNEASLFPEAVAPTALAANVSTIMNDPDTELLDLLQTSADAVREAINGYHDQRRSLTQSRGLLPGVDVDFMANLVFETLNPEVPQTIMAASAATTAKATSAGRYGEKRAKLKTGRKDMFKTSFVVDKTSKSWTTVVAELTKSVADLDGCRKAISDFRFADFIAEGANRVIPPEPPGPLPTPVPKPDVSRMETTNGQTGDPVTGPVNPGPVPDLPNASPEEGQK